MRRHQFLYVLVFSIFFTHADNSVVIRNTHQELSSSGAQEQNSFKNRALEYIKETRPVQWIAWALNKYERENTNNTRIILVKNDMASFIQEDPELECIDPHIIIAHQTTTPDNQFKPIIIQKDAATCPFRLRKVRTPLAVSGQWLIHPSRKTADLSSIISEALEQVVGNEIYFDGFCMTHWVPCINYSLNKPIVDSLF